MGVNYKVTVKNSASYVVDLTDTDVNPDAAPTSTPRQGGFTLRNRINFTNVSTANKTLFTLTGATAATSGKCLRVLEVPERVFVKDVQVFAVKSETVPGSAISATASGLHASALATAEIGINAEQRSKPTSSASYAAASHLDLQLAAQESLGAGAQFGAIPILKNGSSCAFESSLVEAIDSSMTAPELGVVKTRQAGTGSAVYDAVPAYFPLGGYVYLGMTDVATGSVTNSSNTLANSDYLYLTGTWEIQADCTYVPE